MRKKYFLAVIVLNLLFTGQAIAQDSYNVATEVLYIPVVKVGNVLQGCTGLCKYERCSERRASHWAQRL